MPTGLGGGEERDDVGVLERGGNLDLEPESIGAYSARQLGREHLDHDLAPQGYLGREKDSRHAATAELALDGVRAAQPRFEFLLEIVGQGRAPEQPVSM
jgi:hypothetical protein